MVQANIKKPVPACSACSGVVGIAYPLYQTVKNSVPACSACSGVVGIAYPLYQTVKAIEQCDAHRQQNDWSVGVGAV